LLVPYTRDLPSPWDSFAAMSRNWAAVSGVVLLGNGMPAALKASTLIAITFGFAANGVA
jgi:hypothetical protein